jgi:hypothetical protein
MMPGMVKTFWIGKSAAKILTFFFCKKKETELSSLTKWGSFRKRGGFLG